MSRCSLCFTFTFSIELLSNLLIQGSLFVYMYYVLVCFMNVVHVEQDLSETSL